MPIRLPGAIQESRISFPQQVLLCPLQDITQPIDKKLEDISQPIDKKKPMHNIKVAFDYRQLML